jgi:hypothetical protein
MPWTQRDADRFEARLLPDIQSYVRDLNHRDRYRRNRRLEALYRELEPMKFRITEKTFFWGKEREPGEVMDAPTGPYRNTVVGGHGLVRVPQFEEIPVTEETAAPAPTVQTPTQPPPASFAEATAAVIKPAAKPSAPISKTTALLSSLTTRRRKLEEMIVTEATDYSQQLAAMESSAPQIFTQAKTSLDDRQAALNDLSDSLKDFASANGGDPLQG